MQTIILTLQEAIRLKELVNTLKYLQQPDEWDYIDEILAAKIDTLKKSNWED